MFRCSFGAPPDGDGCPDRGRDAKGPRTGIHLKKNPTDGSYEGRHAPREHQMLGVTVEVGRMFGIFLGRLY